MAHLLSAHGERSCKKIWKRFCRDVALFFGGSAIRSSPDCYTFEPHQPIHVENVVIVIPCSGLFFIGSLIFFFAVHWIDAIDVAGAYCGCEIEYIFYFELRMRQSIRYAIWIKKEKETCNWLCAFSLFCHEEKWSTIHFEWKRLDERLDLWWEKSNVSYGCVVCRVSKYRFLAWKFHRTLRWNHRKNPSENLMARPK